MRTLRLIGMTLLTVMLAVNFMACSDDDKDEESFIIGTWVSENTVGNGRYTYTVIFNSDGSGTWTELEEWIPISGTEQTYTDTYSFHYTISGSNLILWNEGDYDTYAITISGTYMTLCGEDATPDDNCLNGFYKFFKR